MADEFRIALWSNDFVCGQGATNFTALFRWQDVIFQIIVKKTVIKTAIQQTSRYALYIEVPRN